MDLAKFPGHSSYRTKIQVFGREVTAGIVYNTALEEGQLQGIRRGWLESLPGAQDRADLLFILQYLQCYDL